MEIFCSNLKEFLVGKVLPLEIIFLDFIQSPIRALEILFAPAIKYFHLSLYQPPCA